MKEGWGCWKPSSQVRLSCRGAKNTQNYCLLKLDLLGPQIGLCSCIYLCPIRWYLSSIHCEQAVCHMFRALLCLLEGFTVWCDAMAVLQQLLIDFRLFGYCSLENHSGVLWGHATFCRGLGLHHGWEDFNTRANRGDKACKKGVGDEQFTIHACFFEFDSLATWDWRRGPRRRHVAPL
jgi:hypothetical protein